MDSKKDFRYQVGIKEVRRVTTILLDLLEELGYDKVELDKTYYWYIPVDQVYDVLSDPSELTIGDLFDEWKELLKIIDDPEMAVTPALVWLGAVYRALGDHTHH